MSMKAQFGYRIINAVRAGSGEPCTIEVNELDGEFVLRTVDKSNVTTMSAVLTTDAARALHKAIGSFLDPING